ncbi:heme ABC transporter ATP-binding protein [Moritella marina ATCC 15381]|uniref:Heme ABC transporter ATP-binding protein n=1 Tax=Moritella marina ATCC 15381 TaxID=1202962 RepID=A0A5J6WIF4_MORMI|nr:heme ABC transporter ATP-binding protein [Moritella marina]QFI37384.1 heme ABC transporter ATP-binding protein [Moritella marina ATCC 15381]
MIVSEDNTAHCAIEAENLNLNLGGKQLLDNFNLKIASGEVTALLGPNGAGKSSLLKVLCGEIDTGGKVKVFGRARKDIKPIILAKHLGVLPQHSSLSFAFTAQEVTELGSLPLQLSNVQTKAIATEKMKLVGVYSLKNQLYTTLSGGEKQRVHFARVLTQLSKAGEQCILMLDEPTSALDIAHQHQTLQVAREIAKSGGAVIVVLHDLNLAAQYADRLVIINKGKIQADGTPWEALTRKLISNVYGWPVYISKHPTDDYPVIIPESSLVK